jgi:hypothetical protein
MAISAPHRLTIRQRRGGRKKEDRRDNVAERHRPVFKRKTAQDGRVPEPDPPPAAWNRNASQPRRAG